MSAITLTPRTTPLPEAADPFRLGWRYVERTDAQGVTRSEQVPLTEWDVLHPEDGDFIVNNQLHALIVMFLYQMLTEHLKGLPDKRVLFDHRVDWQVRGIRPHGPDIVVLQETHGKPIGTQGTYYPDENGGRPLLVIEVTSPTTRHNDVGIKVDHYWTVGIPYYLIVDIVEDPKTEVCHIELTGYERRPRGYDELPVDPQKGIWIPPVNIGFQPDGDRLKCLDEHGIPVPDLGLLKAKVVEQETQLELKNSRIEELERQLAALQKKEDR
jgi:colicin import membrane protein